MELYFLNKLKSVYLQVTKLNKNKNLLYLTVVKHMYHS
jgi:hypothetical protein